eukprot:Nk52_evm2s48 gene=Nk52_evmTU2s48
MNHKKPNSPLLSLSIVSLSLLMALLPVWQVAAVPVPVAVSSRGAEGGLRVADGQAGGGVWEYLRTEEGEEEEEGDGQDDLFVERRGDASVPSVGLSTPKGDIVTLPIANAVKRLLPQRKTPITTSGSTTMASSGVNLPLNPVNTIVKESPKSSSSAALPASPTSVQSRPRMVSISADQVKTNIGGASKSNFNSVRKVTATTATPKTTPVAVENNNHNSKGSMAGNGTGSTSTGGSATRASTPAAITSTATATRSASTKSHKSQTSSHSDYTPMKPAFEFPSGTNY